MEVNPSANTAAPAKVNTDNQTNIYGNVRSQGMLTVRPPEQTQISKESGTDEKQNRELIEKKLEQAVEKLNKMAELFDFKLQFRVHKETQRIISKVIEPDSGKVLKEIPSEKILDMISKLEEMAGLIIDEYV
ncbi:MAG: flagellar protein FlaG [Pelotomaculum sp. PtaB.Bin104]|nr:MAG: flagellar protein FlaG [Pelotomaculum sp. PtaB.Bin104]